MTRHSMAEFDALVAKEVEKAAPAKPKAPPKPRARKAAPVPAAPRRETCDCTGSRAYGIRGY